MPILALLKLIPLKDWLWALLVVVISVGFVTYTVHERHVGAAKIEAADSRAAAAQVAHNKIVEDTALETINVTAKKYEATIASPPVDSPHVFVRLASHPGSVPEATGSACSAPAAAAVSAADTTDIGPGLDTAGRDADAEITALQAIIKADRTEYAPP